MTLMTRVVAMTMNIRESQFTMHLHNRFGVGEKDGGKCEVKTKAGTCDHVPNENPGDFFIVGSCDEVPAQEL